MIERAAVISQGAVIELDESVLGRSAGSETAASDKLEDMERAHILRVLEQTWGKVHGKGGAASILGMHSSTLRPPDLIEGSCRLSRGEERD